MEMDTRRKYRHITWWRRPARRLRSGRTLRTAAAGAGAFALASMVALVFVVSPWTPRPAACANVSNSSGGAGGGGSEDAGILSITPGPGDPPPLIDLSEIVAGGPAPDGIPPLDHPRFEAVPEVDWLEANEPVIAVERCGEARAYPLQVMTWHEIVNDEIAGEPLTITFCPLCNTAYAYVRPRVNDKVTTFGTSGKLYNSNLVMYDRATGSLWPQVLGQAVVGPLTGTQLERRRAQIVSWDDFTQQFARGSVLSRETGFDRPYGDNPYPGYDEIDNEPYRFRGDVDGRLAAVERVLGVENGEEIVAFPYFLLREAGDGGLSVVNTSVGREPVVVIWKAGTVSALDEAQIAGSRDVGAAAAFSRRLDGRTYSFEASGGEVRDTTTDSTWSIFGIAIEGTLEGSQLRPMDHHDSFWFDWAAFHPETKVWRP